jgi:hypothetical protein
MDEKDDSFITPSSEDDGFVLVNALRFMDDPSITSVFNSGDIVLLQQLTLTRYCALATRIWAISHFKCYNTWITKNNIRSRTDLVKTLMLEASDSVWTRALNSVGYNLGTATEDTMRIYNNICPEILEVYCDFSKLLESNTENILVFAFSIYEGCIVKTDLLTNHMYGGMYIVASNFVTIYDPLAGESSIALSHLLDLSNFFTVFVLFMHRSFVNTPDINGCLFPDTENDLLEFI